MTNMKTTHFPIIKLYHMSIQRHCSTELKIKSGNFGFQLESITFFYKDYCPCLLIQSFILTLDLILDRLQVPELKEEGVSHEN